VIADATNREDDHDPDRHSMPEHDADRHSIPELVDDPNRAQARLEAGDK
jgi:hypothetical protein